MSDRYFLDNSACAQRKRLLDALRCSPVTEMEARKNLDIMMPGARIHELRKEGHLIETIHVWQPTDSGKPHSVAQYVLMPNASPRIDDIKPLMKAWGIRP